MPDPYQTLGVSKTATQDEIRKAYRRLAKKLHPDLNPGDKAAEAKFKEVSSAHELLSDADKRRRFDAGEIDASGQEQAPRGFWREHAAGPGGERYYRAGGGGPEDFVDLGSVFSEMFSGRGRTQERDISEDLSASLAVPFLAAARGGKQRVTLPDGRTIDIDIPEGATDRQMLRLKGQGAKHGKAKPGDLYIELHIQPHAFFERRDSDIHMELPVTIREAVLGSRVRVPTVGGAVMLNVPAGSNAGSTLRIKGRGVLDRKSGVRGDQYVKLKLVLPEQADEALKKFLEDWEAGREHDPRQAMEQFT